MANGTPKVIGWFKAYAAFMTALYGVVAGCSLIFFLVEPSKLDTTKGGAVIMGLFLLGLGVVLAAAFCLPFVAKPKPWLWIYDLVLICIGLTSPCCMPASIPLLIYWLKPEAKAYFGRQ